MPYATLSHLPPAGRQLGLTHRTSFAPRPTPREDSDAVRGPEAQEEIAYRVAWAAVKKGYRRHDEEWIAR
jgi:cation transport regulator